ncbi:ABC transporter ATP-binding protein [Roseomonas sp. AR75]|jgi:branched-chain amino acid transport system ATP-binding protein/neutral amino acid transport system ATP-binding protein|uniref:ABC transporter ATP-binding protein n=1 Tax=Roseomonas sp. AR75 TaxID=2562311 RepID=UPI0010C1128D|nr:ABC transporter ATP-binding protein [Roseomonas sp. AR75]
MTAPLLEVRGLVRRFGGVVALDGLDLTVRRGTVTALIGPNGAGKSTAFQCISGVIRPDGGKVIFDGQDITGARPDRVTRAGLVRSFQIARGIPRLTVLENLLLYGQHQPGETLSVAMLGGAATRRREEALRAQAVAVAARLNLTRVLDNPAAALSGGQKKLMEIGRALMAEPRLLLLDEPVAGVNPTLAAEIARHIAHLREEGMTVLVVEHHMDFVASLCDPVIVMAEGKLLAEGGFDSIAGDSRVQEAYMGRRVHA